MERNCSSGLETELRLGVPGVICVKTEMNEKKRDFSYVFGDAGGGGEAEKKNQVVGWPPVRAYRRKNSFNDQKKLYVKVSVDGAPFLRKIDLSMHKGYTDLVMALEQLFGCQGIGGALNDSDNDEYVPTYEDKDGDLMMLGDVPWEMFIESCKRLRIMKKPDTNDIDGLQAKDLLKGLSNTE